MLSDYELRRSRLFPYHFMADNPAPPEPNPPEPPGVPQASSAGSGQAGFAELGFEEFQADLKIRFQILNELLPLLELFPAFVPVVDLQCDEDAEHH